MLHVRLSFIFSISFLVSIFISVSQVEYGVLHLVDADNPQITVLVDCEGLSPVRIPMQIIRSCSSLLKDHFPNRLGCMFVIRLPANVHVIAQTFIQVSYPSIPFCLFSLKWLIKWQEKVHRVGDHETWRGIKQIVWLNAIWFFSGIQQPR